MSKAADHPTPTPSDNRLSRRRLLALGGRSIAIAGLASGAAALPCASAAPSELTPIASLWRQRQALLASWPAGGIPGVEFDARVEQQVGLEMAILRTPAATGDDLVVKMVLLIGFTATRPGELFLPGNWHQWPQDDYQGDFDDAALASLHCDLVGLIGHRLPGAEMRA